MTPARRTRTGLLVGIAAVAAAVTLLAVSATLGITVYGQAIVVSLIRATLQALAIPLALRRPRWAALIAAGAMVLSAILNAPVANAPWPVSVSVMIAFALAIGLAARLTTWRLVVATWAVSMTALLGIALLRDHGAADAGAITADLIVVASISALAIAVGVLVSGWQETRRLLTEERALTAEETIRRTLAEDRTRLARELHDVVAHGLSEIQVRAASARYRIPDVTPAAATEFDDLAAAARATVGEMRQLLGVLRKGDAAELRPQPGIDALADLIASFHGGAVTFEDGLGQERDADPLVQLTIYRLVQEALSNVARHAPGAAVRVTLAPHGASDIAVAVTNEPPRRETSPAAESAGLGLRGMRERVELVGGTVSAGPTASGGFAVHAVIPRREVLP